MKILKKKKLTWIIRIARENKILEVEQQRDLSTNEYVRPVPEFFYFFPGIIIK